jgi:hypothetical protein
MYRLESDKEYDVRIYHFHPKDEPSKVTLSVVPPSRLAGVIRGGTLIADSRYDLKRVRLKTSSLPKSERGSITVNRVDASIGDARTVDFDLSIEVAGQFWSTLGKGILFGVLLAAPQVVAILGNSNFAADNRPLTLIIVGAAGLAAGIVGAFSLKKPA